MKIHKLKVIECNRFKKGIEFDFTDSIGRPYSEVVIAGENGAGKTTVLALIEQSLNWVELCKTANQDRNFIQARYEVYVSFTDFEIKNFQESSSSVMGAVFQRDVANEKELYLLEIDTLSDVNQRKCLFHALDNFKIVKTRHHNIYCVDDNAWNSYIRPLFLLPEIQFTGSPVKETKGSAIDSKTGGSRFRKNESQEIKQMLVDVYTGDSTANQAEMSEEQDLDGDTFKRRYFELEDSSRISRFKKAFNNFFEHLRFVEVSNRNSDYPGEHVILFEKNGNKFDIEGLSSGEKQIVYRGAFLMKDAGVRRSVIALIDEPEISLHPVWQRKITKYYSEILNEDSKSDSQVFIATHSPYVIQGAENACFYIMNKNNDGSVEVNKHIDFENWTPNQLSIDAFHLDSLHSGQASEKIKELKKRIGSVKEGTLDYESSDFQDFEGELRKLLRSDEAVLLSADLLELSNQIGKLKYDSSK